jgi:aspartate/glutamate racemase
MPYAYMSGWNQPEGQIFIPKGRTLAGHSIGILVLDVWYPLVPGNVANASTYDFPVLLQILKGATIEQVVAGDSSLLPLIIDGARELEQQGVRAIVGACGYLASYQKEVAAALQVPIFLSSLLQVPMIMRALKADQTVGIICAEAKSLTPDTLLACGIEDPSRITIADAQGIPEFLNISRSTGHLDNQSILVGLVDVAKQLVNNSPEVGAILLECSDMPPYAWAIQDAVRLPVFDFITMIHWIHDAAVRRPFNGFI